MQTAVHPCVFSWLSLHGSSDRGQRRFIPWSRGGVRVRRQACSGCSCSSGIQRAGGGGCSAGREPARNAPRSRGHAGDVGCAGCRFAHDLLCAGKDKCLFFFRFRVIRLRPRFASHAYFDAFLDPRYLGRFESRCPLFLAKVLSEFSGVVVLCKFSGRSDTVGLVSDIECRTCMRSMRSMRYASASRPHGWFDRVRFVAETQFRQCSQRFYLLFRHQGMLSEVASEGPEPGSHSRSSIVGTARYSTGKVHKNAYGQKKADVIINIRLNIQLSRRSLYCSAREGTPDLHHLQA